MCFHSLTEVSSKGSHFAIKEGNTQKHTQSVKQIGRQPAADRKTPRQKRLKNKGFDFFVLHFSIRKIFLWKNKCFFSLFSVLVFIYIRNAIKPMLFSLSQF